MVPILRRLGLALGDDIDRMDDAGEIAQEGEQDIDPELWTDAYLQEHAERRQKDGDDDAQKVQNTLLNEESNRPSLFKTLLAVSGSLVSSIGCSANFSENPWSAP